MTYRAKSIGYEIDNKLVQIARDKIKENGLEDLVRIESSDMYEADLSGVSVVAVYLYPTALEKLKAQFVGLRPGSRIVAHHFEIPGVEPAKVLTVASEESGNEHRILLYTTPLKPGERATQ